MTKKKKISIKKFMEISFSLLQFLFLTLINHVTKAAFVLLRLQYIKQQIFAESLFHAAFHANVPFSSLLTFMQRYNVKAIPPS